jgi:hypothetical protein
LQRWLRPEQPSHLGWAFSNRGSVKPVPRWGISNRGHLGIFTAWLARATRTV